MHFNYPHDPGRYVLLHRAVTLVVVYIIRKKLSELEREVLLILVIIIASVIASIIGFIGFINYLRLL